MSTGETWTLGHRPALDGLRGIAVLFVVVCHFVATDNWAALGSYGVTAFFALSGFLITALLLEEMRRRDGRVHFRGFYMRRARRLLPALVAMVTLFSVVQYALTGTIAPFGPVLLYVSNWSRAAGTDLAAFGHTWSLSIEEQFYLVWPPLLVYAAHRWGQRSVLALALAGAAASAAARWGLWVAGASGDRIYNGSDTRAEGLLLGCALAAWLVGRQRDRLPQLPGWVPVVALVALAVTGRQEPGPFFYLVAPSVAAAAALLVIYATATGTPDGVLGWRPLRWVGRRSYGLYLWHFPMLALAAWGVLSVPAALAASVLMTVVSWRYVEQPFMRGGRLADRGTAPVRRLHRPRTHDTTAAREAEPVIAPLHNPQGRAAGGRLVVHHKPELVDRDPVVAGDRVAVSVVTVDEGPHARSEVGTNLG